MSSEFTFGPVEFYLVGHEGDGPDAATMQAFTDLLATGLVRLLDFVLIAKSDAGEVTITEIEGDLAGVTETDLGASGIAGEDDIAEFADLIPPGASAVLVALELAYQRDLADRVAASGAVLLGYERVPAPAVNALFDALNSEGD